MHENTVKEKQKWLLRGQKNKFARDEIGQEVVAHTLFMHYILR